MYSPGARGVSDSGGPPRHASRARDFAACGIRLAIQFNNEPPIVQVSDERGGPRMLYHGHELDPNQVKSVVVIRGKEARERFGDRKLDAAILIELK
jgi:hypothetical protein